MFGVLCWYVASIGDWGMRNRRYILPRIPVLLLKPLKRICDWKALRERWMQGRLLVQPCSRGARWEWKRVESSW